MEHAHTGAVESVFRSVKMCVCYQLPSTSGHAEESVCSTGRPVFIYGNAYHENPGRAAVRGAAAVSDGYSHIPLFVFML